MNGKLTIEVKNGSISIQGDLNGASEAGELAVVHSLMRAMGYQGDSLAHALMNLILVDQELLHKEVDINEG